MTLNACTAKPWARSPIMPARWPRKFWKHPVWILVLLPPAGWGLHSGQLTAARRFRGKYINPSLAEKLADVIDKPNTEFSHDKLSDREYQIMCSIASGKSAEEIAEDLVLSIHTVYSYRNRILEKMQLKSNVELTQYAIQYKLIEI